MSNADNLSAYDRIIDNICDLVESGRLHWRHYNAGMAFLATLLRQDVHFKARTVHLIVNNLGHDSLEVRKTSIFALSGIMKLQKKKHVLVERPVATEPVKRPLQPGNRQVCRL